MTEKTRAPTTVEHVTKQVNEVLGEQGCNYCQRYYPATRVRKKRNKFGLTKWICDGCEEGRRTRKGKTQP